MVIEYDVKLRFASFEFNFNFNQLKKIFISASFICLVNKLDIDILRINTININEN
jgi:hypothetical protein